MTLSQYIVLCELNKVNIATNPFDAKRLMNKSKVKNDEKMYALIIDLKNKGYINKFTANQFQQLKSVELSYTGFRFRQTIFIRIIKIALTWFFNNIVGIAAFLIALKALLLELQ